MHRSRREVAARIAVVLAVLGVITLLASFSGGPNQAKSCAEGFVLVAGHCVLSSGK